MRMIESDRIENDLMSQSPDLLNALNVRMVRKSVEAVESVESVGSVLLPYADVVVKLVVDVVVKVVVEVVVMYVVVTLAVDASRHQTIMGENSTVLGS